MKSRKWQIGGTTQCRLSTLLTANSISLHRHRVSTRLTFPPVMYSIRIVVPAQLSALLEEPVEEIRTKAQSYKWEVKSKCIYELYGVLEGRICAGLFQRFQSRLFLSSQATFPATTVEVVYSVLEVEGWRSVDE